MLQRTTARTLSLDKILYHQGLSFGIVRHSRQVQRSFVQSVDALIIQTASDRAFEDIARQIRNMPQPEEYLKPLFMVANPSLKPTLQNETDGITELTNLSAIAETARAIHREIARIALVEYTPQTPEVDAVLKILQFLFTRKKELLPFPSRYSKVHFHFPFATHCYEEHEEHKILHVLKLADKQGWLTGKVVEKVHLCPDCGSAHQTMRATCPKCNSVDLTEQDLVHHFPCAYIGPISDFQNPDMNGLHCPKCDKSLRHIGNDYDKPSSIYNCNSCRHDFQQSDFRSLCVDCGADNDLQNLREWDIKGYRLSAKGKSIVLNGTGFGKAVIAKAKMPVASGIYEFDVFKILLRQELAHRRVNPRPGVIGQVKIEGLVLDHIPMKTREELALEICQVIKSYLTEPDVVSAKGPGLYYFMITENGLAEVQYLIELLSYNIGQLISSNFDARQITVQVKLEPMVKD
ncbi:MAG TPA: hypothetical protein ENJ20_04235 [Bacteroidetes bacterium]|nr:hypothetical protein [Bacteroidota bacterium]